MLRNVLAFVAGLAVSIAVISGFQYLNSLLFPLPAGLDPKNPDDVAAIVAQAPFLAMLGVEISYAAGSLLGGAIIGTIASHRAVAFALGLGALLTVFNITNLVSIPHPLWMAILTTITFVPLTWLGARLTAKG